MCYQAQRISLSSLLELYLGRLPSSSPMF
uniref:Uncharacterized protein n=1 Tax=Arundo donax TaxID=35708 RepID=A0A0A8ZPW9_ARUDO